MNQGKQKKRILLVTNDNNIVADVLRYIDHTGFIIDHVKSRKEAVIKFIQFRHSIILAGVELLPRTHDRIIDLKYMAHKNPVIIIMSPSEKLAFSYSYLRTNNADDILYLPIDRGEFGSKISNAVRRHHFSARGFFIRDISFAVLITLPLLIYLILLLFE